MRIIANECSWGYCKTDLLKVILIKHVATSRVRETYSDALLDAKWKKYKFKSGNRKEIGYIHILVELFCRDELKMKSHIVANFLGVSRTSASANLRNYKKPYPPHIRVDLEIIKTDLSEI